MTFKAYPQYKASGVEWLGDVPESWSTTRLKYLVSSVDSGVSVNAIDVPASDGEIGVLKTSCVYGDIFRIAENKAIWESERARASCSLKGNTLIVSRMNTPALVGSCGYVRQDYPKIFLPDRLWMISFNALIATQVTKFLWYRLTCDAFKTHLPVIATGTSDSMKNIAQGDFFGLPMAMPEPKVCSAIATFLDRETAKIDTLINKQEAMIELLKEKRQAVISQAVTKGLDLNVPMRDSGEEWLGDVPEGWEIRKLAHSFDKIGSGTTPKSDVAEYYDTEEFPWVNTGDLNDSDLYSCGKSVSNVALETYSSLKIYPPASVVIAMYGATIGKLAILRFPATVNQACCVFVGENVVQHRFLFYWLFGFRDQIVSMATGGGQPNISQETLRTLRIACPQIPEQSAIAAFLDRVTARIDALIAKAQQAITLQKEHRTALISAAVTGKIDVRDAIEERKAA